MAVTTSSTIERELRALLGDDSVLPGATREYLSDYSETHNVRGRADAVALPRDADAVAATVRWCDEHDVPMIPRGGGTGLAGGAVPLAGGVVISLERLNTPVTLEPELWRAHVPAGARTGDFQRRARESGLFYAPDPGALEQSQIGGNIATNAGGPHAFKYGVTGTWVRGLELVLASGEQMSIGGPVRKDVAGYDLRSLIVGSEGTLAIVTAAWLRLVPAPDVVLPVIAFYPDVHTGCRALATVMGAGLQPAALEYLDEPAVAAGLGAFPGEAPSQPAFLVLAEADGSAEEAARLRDELLEAMGPGSLATYAPEERGEIRELWRWRGGVGPAVTTTRGGKISEDIVVPLDHLAEGILATREIGDRLGLPACSWGHAGDGNLHSTFMVDLTDPEETARAETGVRELYALAASLGGSVSGEHGLGITKRGALALQWPEPALALHEGIKRLFDPKGLLNPQKKVARPSG
ncbi:MAG TPA: FAD-linked oxidase C-terminal domain-containing protein [Solirubrobacteraceae bacterium]|nr:FAD-linked oxidase C-terminal domain-containing protein [Solirubrobacteraceae bacterium]